MRRIREVLRLKYELSRNHREISAATGLSKGSVSTYLSRAREAGLDWQTARELSESELEARLFKTPGRNLPVDRVPIDHAWVHREMRKKAVTLQLLWVEYREAALTDPQKRRPYQYSQFCERHGKFREHRGGVARPRELTGLDPLLRSKNISFALATRPQSHLCSSHLRTGHGSSRPNLDFQVDHR